MFGFLPTMRNLKKHLIMIIFHKIFVVVHVQAKVIDAKSSKPIFKAKLNLHILGKNGKTLEFNSPKDGSYKFRIRWTPNQVLNANLSVAKSHYTAQSLAITMKPTSN